MHEEHTPAEQRLLARWLEMSDEALQDTKYEGVSEHMRCSAAFEAGYVCALHLLGPTALTRYVEHPSEVALRDAAEVASVDVSPGLQHLEHRLRDPANMPSLAAMLAWAHVMRRLVPVAPL